MSNNVTRLRQPKPCPICNKQSVQVYHPFCSARCADVDLNRWLNGSYVVPGKPSEENGNEQHAYGEDEDDNI
ncbi:DNA gyrase inhibitor YacG [Pelagibacterium lentulum]|uniref:DNA gyrase inhibitor YacG n=1 Tax=Pelagibacterium lentulum TaxID=2029865 RepID=A0A916R8B1_9HYPH|nr:DNA gyrase inhibitor YacG [Pelagibacterium lentulum]GGA41042.1 hypothetical protein GCM10011499_08270 [Pelagibacterium lentulum]